ncbi:hypothetical protein ACIOMM_36525 [Streptomyces sp. NPDC087908]|uniref:hypothetical protein n=1 Tax=Streptomyces sp. NPDC087908 TaxID=3365820 RepID=UPI0038308BE0
MAMDKRRVQSADSVIGHADSEIPVVLPMEAMELDFFRARHDGHTFWCEVWLGGCGQRLTNKLYTDRACHFAHLPDPEHISTCARKASGISSADHLFIKSGLLEWLSDQEVQAAADIVRGTDGSITGEVLFTLASHAGLHIPTRRRKYARARMPSACSAKECRTTRTSCSSTDTSTGFGSSPTVPAAVSRLALKITPVRHGSTCTRSP